MNYRKEKPYFDFDIPTKIYFGPGKLVAALEEIERNDFKKIGIVTTKEIQNLGLLEDLTAPLNHEDYPYKIYSDVVTNPHLSTVTETVNCFNSFNPDCLIGFGGGSVLDCAKSAGLCLAHGVNTIAEFQGETRPNRSSVPVITVPTTAGTGSEVDYWAVLSNPDTNEKISFGYPEMSPHAAIVDPELTRTLPPRLTLFTGLDALSHAIEAFFSSSSNEFSDLFALEGIKLTFRSLSRTVDNGNDISARGDMALASLLAGAAMQHVGLGLIHAISHQISGFYDTNHGLANALLLNEVIKFNYPAIPSKKANALDSIIQPDLCTGITALLEQHNLKNKQVAINKRDLCTMAERAKDNVNADTNPREASIKEIKEIIKQSFNVQ